MNAIPSARRPAPADRPLLVAAAVIVGALVFAGFARTFYLRPLYETAPLSRLLLLHGLVMTAWVAVFVAQLALVAARRTDLHRRMGVAGGVVAALAVVFGVLAAIDAGRRGFTPSPEVTSSAFMAVPLVDVVVFGGLVAAALALRRRPAAHKRLMLLATFVLLTPAIARLPIDGLREAGLPAFFGAMIALMLAVVAVDTVRHRRLHPAFGWGAALLIALVPLRVALSQTEAWGRIAAWLVR